VATLLVFFCFSYVFFRFLQQQQQKESQLQGLKVH